MNKHLCSLHLIPKPSEESEAYLAQKKEWPHAACHDGVNKAFAATHPLETDAIKAYEWVDAAGVPLSTDARAWAMARVLVGSHPPIHDTQANFRALYRHPAYRLFIGKYEDSLQFRADIDFIAEAIVDETAKAAWINSTKDILYEDVRWVIVNMLRAA